MKSFHFEKKFGRLDRFNFLIGYARLTALGLKTFYCKFRVKIKKQILFKWYIQLGTK